MSTTYGYLDHLIDDKAPNPVENIWLRCLLVLHRNHKMPFYLLPKKLKNILTQWDEEMKGGVCYGCREERGDND